MVSSFRPYTLFRRDYCRARLLTYIHYMHTYIFTCVLAITATDLNLGAPHASRAIGAIRNHFRAFPPLFWLLVSIFWTKRRPLRLGSFAIIRLWLRSSHWLLFGLDWRHSHIVTNMSSYYDLDAILAEEELVPCVTNFDFSFLARLDPDFHPEDANTNKQGIYAMPQGWCAPYWPKFPRQQRTWLLFTVDTYSSVTSIEY